VITRNEVRSAVRVRPSALFFAYRTCKHVIAPTKMFGGLAAVVNSVLMSYSLPEALPGTME
jgi:hypothetical protein